MKRLLPLLSIAFLIGCQERDTSVTVFGEQEDELRVELLLDQSPSFADFMEKDGHAYAHALDLVMRTFRTSIGTSNKLIIAQIAGPDRRTILYEGSPLDFKRRHARTADEFRVFLKSHASAGGGSLVRDAIIRSTDYMAGKKGKSVLLVLSDMHDEGSRSTDDDLMKALSRFGAGGGACAIYYCHEAYMQAWQERLATAGVKERRVEGMFVERPELPFSE